ncbi:MAG: trigger factor [Candidatus Ratteibacteria bacterium]|nr:trigger factor [Candidatus Ratteibacteria bacterium]
MKVQIKKIDDCQRTLEIEIPSESMQEAFERVLSRFQKNTVLPGFRRGKVSRELLLSRLGKDIEGEVIQSTVSHSYVTALKESDFWPLGDPEISKVKWKPNSSLCFEAKVEVRPEIKLGNYKGLKVIKESSAVLESELDSEIKNVQERMAAYSIISDRVLQDGDLAIVDLEIYVEGKLIPGGKSNDFSLEVGKDLFGPGFDQRLSGFKIGEKKIIEVTLPANHPSSHLSNKKAFFHITLKQIREKKLPPLDDELARRVKDCQGLDDLKQKIKKRLQSRKAAESLRKMKDELILRLLQSTDLPLPLSLIARREEALLEYTLRRLKGFGYSEEKIKGEEKELKEGSRKKAEEEVKLALILEAVAEKENIIVSKEEAKEELKKISQYSKRKVPEEEIDSTVIEQLRHNKVLDFLLSFAVIQEVKS